MVLPFVVGTLGVVVLMPLSSAMDDGEFNSGCGLWWWWWRRGWWTMKTAFNGSGGRGGGGSMAAAAFNGDSSGGYGYYAMTR
jgi:hypothetical protein